MFISLEVVTDSAIFDKYAVNPRYFVPYSFGLNSLTQQLQINEVATKFKQMYFNSQNPSANIMAKWVDFQTDAGFSFGIDRTVRYYANKTTHPLYYYLFSVDGATNMIKKVLNLNFPGACHNDVSWKICFHSVIDYDICLNRILSTSGILKVFHSLFCLMQLPRWLENEWFDYGQTLQKLGMKIFK